MSLKPHTQAGPYLFRAPSKPQFRVTRNLLLVFCVPKAGFCSAVLSAEDTSPAALREMLDKAFTSLLEHLGNRPLPILPKLFGLSHGNETQLRCALGWLTQHGLKLVAKDVGRQFPRQILVDCETGRVAVSYGRVAGSPVPELLTTGSARARWSRGDAPAEVLVLADNPVQRQLAVQAVEDHAGWRAFAPADPFAWISRRSKEPFRWPLTLIFDEAAPWATLGQWIESVRVRHPDCRLALVGEPPAEMRRKFPALPVFSNPDPEFLGEFKASLSELLPDGPRRPLAKSPARRKKAG